MEGGKDESVSADEGFHKKEFSQDKVKMRSSQVHRMRFLNLFGKFVLKCDDKRQLWRRGIPVELKGIVRILKSKG